MVYFLTNKVREMILLSGVGRRSRQLQRLVRFAAIQKGCTVFSKALLVMSKQKDGKTGLAFSGGGVRSAALCSGVLRRMLQKEVSIDYLSCVSGGGYTGASYMDWKYRNENKDDPIWHKEYFDHLRTHSNPFCNCRNPCAGLFDALTLVFLVFAVSLVLPWLAAFTFAIPTAYIIDFFFGDIMRLPFTCPYVATNNFTASQIAENPEIIKELKLNNGTAECVHTFGPHMYKTISLYTSMLVAFLLFYFLKTLLEQRRTVYYFFRLVSNLIGFALAMTFLPWFIEEYIVVTPLWVNALVIVFSIFIWLGFPPLRDKASLALIVYFYAYAVKWRVYKTPILGYKYTHLHFMIMLWSCGVLLWLLPFIGMLQQNSVHHYNAWRLHKSFFSPESARTPSHICADIMPCASNCCQSKERLNKPLTLGDIVEIQPEYKCNVTANHWHKSEKRDDKPFELLILSPTVIERLDRAPLDEEFESAGFIGPTDVKLSSAMASSAASVSYDLGSLQNVNEPFRDLQMLLGLGLGKNLVAQPALRNVNCFLGALPFILQFLMAAPLLALPLLHHYGDGPRWDGIGVIVFVTAWGILTLISLFPTGEKNPGCLEKFARWCIINVSHVRFMREVMSVTNVGPTPPPVMHLTDGGHIENLAVLPLLKLRLPRIVVVNGGSLESGDTCATDLLALLQQARDKLRCSFTALDGRDIIEDVREKFVEPPSGNQPRSYRFLVQYYEKGGDDKTIKVGQGEIILLSPRHPDDGIIQFKDHTWKDFSDDHVTLDLDESAWGRGPYLKASEVDRLTGCCCECCHWGIFRWLFRCVSGRFPYHPTSNQLYTPAMFSAYHREGYRACVEAEADKFLSGETNQ